MTFKMKEMCNSFHAQYGVDTWCMYIYIYIYKEKLT